MTEREKQVEKLAANYAGEYGVQFLRDLLKSGLCHVGEVGLDNVSPEFIEKLTVLETAISRIENKKVRGRL